MLTEHRHRLHQSTDHTAAARSMVTEFTTRKSMSIIEYVCIKRCKVSIRVLTNIIEVTD